MSTVNSYISHHSSGVADPFAIFVKPYEEGAKNLKAAFIGKRVLDNTCESLDAKSTPKKLNHYQRIKHFIVGIGLMIPIVNVIVSVALRHFASHPSKKSPTDVQTPVSPVIPLSKKGNLKDQLNKAIYQIKLSAELENDGLLMNHILHVEQVVSKLKKNGTVKVGCARYNHNLHWHLTKITRKVATLPKVNEVWKGFLDLMENKVKLVYPNGKKIRLDLSREKEILKNPSHKDAINIYLAKGLSQKELKEILEVENESFTLSYPPKMYYHFSRAKHGCCLLLAKDSKTKQVVGTLLVNNGHIVSLARRANAVSMGVGWTLFRGLAEVLQGGKKKPKNLKLEVRSSNAPAIHLYEKLGFQKTHVTKGNYYKHPKEPAFKMNCAYSTFIERVL